jgi:hypothetical protein
MDLVEPRERDDVLLYETPTGLTGFALPTIAPQPEPVALDLVLYVISLFGVHNQTGDRIDGDALIVRAPNQPDNALLAAVLGCTEPELPVLLNKGGTWAIRQIKTIDGYRLRFEGA